MHARTLLILLTLIFVISWGTAFAAGDGSDSGAPPPQEDEEHDDEDHEGEEHGEEEDVLDFHAHDVVVVTGSAIEEPAVDLPYAVEILNRELQKEQGSLQTVDLIKNLTASSGVIGEANSWYNDQGTAVPENVANVNLRGLGASGPRGRWSCSTGGARRRCRRGCLAAASSTSTPFPRLRSTASRC